YQDTPRAPSQSSSLKFDVSGHPLGPNLETLFNNSMLAMRLTSTESLWMGFTAFANSLALDQQQRASLVVTANSAKEAERQAVFARDNAHAVLNKAKFAQDPAQDMVLGMFKTEPTSTGAKRKTTASSGADESKLVPMKSGSKFRCPSCDDPPNAKS